MAQLGNLLVTGSSRLLGKLFCNDISVGNSLSVKTLSATNFTATSITTSGLTVNGNATTTGTLNVGNSQANGKISINGKVSIRDYANNGWLGINDTLAWTNGVYFGKTTVRTDGIFQVGDAGNKVLFNQSSAKFTVPVTINNSLAANNITATNVTVNDTLKAFKYELNTIQDLGGEFCVAPTIYIQSGATVNVSKASSTTITVSILDKTAITSDSIQGVRWAQNSKIKFQGKIDGLNIRCSGIMAAKLNTTVNTMSLTLTVESAIADHFATAKNGVSYSDISVMLYQRYGKKIGSTIENVYSPVGIRMSATGNANSAPYVDIWGNKSNSDPDTVYTVPSVRLGYLDGLKCGTYDCVGYGLYADNVYLNGTIISNSGTIGGFNINTNALVNGTWGTDKSVLMSTGTTENKAVGGSSAISGWCFTAGSKFGVTTSGDLYASNVNISGKVTSDNITATSGSIGSFKLDSTYLQSSDKTVGLSASSSDWAFWAGGSSATTAKFRVTRAGQLYTSNITAYGGTIGGWTIIDSALSKNLTQLYSSDEGTYLGLDGIRINDSNYGISLNGGLLKLWKKGNFAGGIFPTGGYEETDQDSWLILCNTEEHKGLRFGTSTSSKTTLGNIDKFSLCYQISNDTTYKNIFYNGVNIDNWYFSKTRISGTMSSNANISMGAGGAGLILCNEDGKPVIWIQDENSKLTFRVDRDGTMYHNDNVLGEIISKTVGEKSMNSGTWTDTGASVTLPAGQYVVNGTVLFNSAANGQRGARFATSPTDYFRESQQMNIAGTTKGVTSVQCSYIANLKTSTKLNLQGIQSSGATLSTINSYIQAIRIS